MKDSRHMSTKPVAKDVLGVKQTLISRGRFLYRIGFCLVAISVTMAYFSCKNQGIQPTVVNTEQKIVIYQLLPRLFGDKDTANVPYGTIAQNGSGKFNDITDEALDGLKELHVNYVWYTGVIAHASLTDYSKFGLKANDADVVKGRAGSPYAIRDYYDVDPDLAVNVGQRMQEFENLIKRTHAKNLKVLIDFVPNHVARSYHSNAKPKSVIDFGANDIKDSTFSIKNDFYYIPGKPFVVPKSNQKANPLTVLQDGKYNENPAKATGNNVFSASPTVNDWYETVKLNYGVDYRNNSNHFMPIPPVWEKMKDILTFWTKKGVDGFRCDVAEMVPVEFWAWVIPQIKQVNPNLIFIGEAYNSALYSQFIHQGKFDYLYDKVGLYDGLKKLIKNDSDANVADITKVIKADSAGLDNHMLRFLENHDEERIASKGFAGKPEFALPAMVVTATLGKGPVMIYFGQEVGEPAKGKEGFGGDDNRTTIFDYWGVPNHQKWMDGGKFDGGKLNAEQKSLRKFYEKLLAVATQSNAIQNGQIYQVAPTAAMTKRTFAYIRKSDNQRLLIVVNFDRTMSLNTTIQISPSLLKSKPLGDLRELLGNAKVVKVGADGIKVSLSPISAQIIEF
ncbi:glycosidase [Pedobacter sp. UYP30]|uniref:alpha-amylase family glycosyl hydrolase n=1 Tax=Pedobacter sp. UYP30 TaxID=1756400 RepID=UPI0033971200